MPIYRFKLPIAIALILGTSLSALTAGAIARQERIQNRLQFQRQTDSLSTALQRSLDRYTDVLRSLGDFYRASDQPVSSNDFNRFVERALFEYPGIQALEWAPIVEDANRAEFESLVRVEKQTAFQITERESRGKIVRAGQRAYYVPVTHLQPWAGNEPALGYDLASDSIRKVALEVARDRGAIATSGRIRLVQENKNKFGFLVFLPVYEQTTETHSVADRREQIQGYLLGVFRVSDVVEESLAAFNEDINFTLIDEAAAPKEQFLGHYRASTQTLVATPIKQKAKVTNKRRAFKTTVPVLCAVSADCTHLLNVGEREWAITFEPADNYPLSLPWIALSTLITGLMLTTVIVRYWVQTQAELSSTQELSQLKIRLFSMASHELRTPLSIILLSAQSLEVAEEVSEGTAEIKDIAVNESVQEKLRQRTQIYRRIRASAKRMNQLLSDLLTLARAESGKIEFLPETINLVTFCEQTIEEVRFSFEKAPRIHLITDLSLSPAAYVDPQLLQAILTNLLSNAVKYSRSNPQISLTLTYHFHQIVFQIKDQGIGISKADQKNLTTAFYRGSNVGSAAGTGLGLSIVHACLQLHKGTLACHSNLGEGTTFEVSLPRID